MAYYDLLARNELFIANGDALVVNGWNSVVGQSLTIRTRRRTPQGDLVTSENTLALTADRLANTLAISLNDGTLVGVAVHPTVAVQRGQTFVRIGLARGAGNPEQMTLAQDYVTIAAPLGWPGGRIASPTEGPGVLRNITGTTPAAGSNWSETVPTNARWRVRGVLFAVTTDATDVIRYVGVLLDDGANILRVFQGGSLGANSSSNFFYDDDPTQYTIAGFGSPAHRSMIKVVARAGYRIRSRTDNLQAGDQYSSIQLQVEEWIDV